SDSDGVRGRGDTPDIIEEPEPTAAESDYESNYNYLCASPHNTNTRRVFLPFASVSRLAAVDQAIHKMNVGHYTLDVKVSQLLDRLLRLEGKVADVEDSIYDVSNFCRDNRREIGRLEGCVKGRKVGQKCFLVYRVYDTYVGASQKCQERGGRMAMPRDRREQEALAEYVKLALPGSNWPVWLGINDLRSEGLYLFDDSTRVTYFQWRKHFLSSQPDGGKRENCVAMSSDDGDWWDNYCDRRMYYLCEFEA
ncbi:hypothetical protein QTP86_027202, partial [Hemibagrus guttatus]